MNLLQKPKRRRQEENQLKDHANVQNHANVTRDVKTQNA